MTAARPPLAVHVDLDGADQIFRVHGRRYRGPGDPIFSSGVDAMLELFERESIRATLFVIAEDLRIPEKRQTLARAVAQGHELASHTVSHLNLLRATADRKRSELTDSKAMIEDAFGAPVRGFRAPGYSIDAESLAMLAGAGYAYDSSAFPNETFARRTGVPVERLRGPERLEQFGGLVELPLPGPAPRSIPIGPSFALTFGLPPFYWAMARAARRGAPAVLLFHLIDFAAPLEREYRESARLSLFTLSTRSLQSKRDACTRMLRFVRRRFELTSTRRLLADLAA